MLLKCTKMLLVLFLVGQELLKSASKIIMFLPYPQLGCVKLSLESNPIPYPEYSCLSISEFFVKLTAPNSQLCKVIPIFIALVISS